MHRLLFLFLLLSSLVVFLPGCEPKEDLVQTSGSLELAADTVLFDTVFTTVRTVTKRLWVYNRNSGAVKTDISLEGLAGNTYTLVINGDLGPSSSGLTIRGNDSLLVLVRATLGDNGGPGRPFLVEDKVHFRTNGNDQVTRLIAYGQNAYFHSGEVIGGGGTVTWPTDKPHVIFNKNIPNGPTATVSVGVAVAHGTTLRIPRGARIYCHAGATLQVDGTLLVNDLYNPNGTVKDSSADRVRFQGDRLESFYSDVPGQWGGIFFTNESRGNIIRYAEIKNATFGLLLANPRSLSPRPEVTVDNTTIRNISGSNVSFANSSASTGGGIISYSGEVTARNCLFTNCGEYAVLGVGWGVYQLNYCTIANYTPSFRRETASLTFTNENAVDNSIKEPISVKISNSIVWGSIKDELFLENYGDPGYLVEVRNTLLRSEEYQADARITTPFFANLLNEDPKFMRTPLNAVGRFDYSLDALSPALNRPRPALVFPVTTTDLLNVGRPSPATQNPDAGAYERIN
jgi:hypothetical protein